MNKNPSGYIQEKQLPTPPPNCGIGAFKERKNISIQIRKMHGKSYLAQ